jgi:hypothetical protein
MAASTFPKSCGLTWAACGVWCLPALEFEENSDLSFRFFSDAAMIRPRSKKRKK